MRTLGNKLIELRQSRNLTQEEVASDLHVSREAVSNWERSKRYPDVMMLGTIAKYYEVSADELIFPEEYPKYVEVTPIMETKEETNLELIIFSALFVLYLIKLLFDLTVEYWPTLIDWLLEDIVFLPVLAYATYKSYKKEVSPKVIGYMFIYSMMSFFIKRLYMNIRADMIVGFKWINIRGNFLINYSFPLTYSAVIYLFYKEGKNELEKERQNNLIYWILIVLTAVYALYHTFWYFEGFTSDLFGWNEHFIYNTISKATKLLMATLMVQEAMKLRKKRIQAKESVSK
ncbi:MAG: helix-turn-helix domain-containing protein [Erysipelotrichaceae bacterium]|nr:helix-turn-helix domain-containing protein [Erysipelotrichaceae bacterium]